MGEGGSERGREGGRESQLNLFNSLDDSPSSYPDHEQLQTVYGTYLRAVLHHSLETHPLWGSTAKIHALASSMVQVYEQVGRCGL